MDKWSFNLMIRNYGYTMKEIKETSKKTDGQL